MNAITFSFGHALPLSLTNSSGVHFLGEYGGRAGFDVFRGHVTYDVGLQELIDCSLMGVLLKPSICNARPR